MISFKCTCDETGGHNPKSTKAECDYCLFGPSKIFYDVHVKSVEGTEKVLVEFPEDIVNVFFHASQLDSSATAAVKLVDLNRPFRCSIDKLVTSGRHVVL